MKNRNCRKLAFSLLAFLVIGVVSSQKVGDSGPGGGIIFYAKQDYSDGWKYLEAAPSDLDASKSWHNRDPVTGETTAFFITIYKTMDGIGRGQQNTKLIIESLGGGNYAALACSRLSMNSYSDWFLPSKDELNCLYAALKLNGIGGLKDSRYWSSSETSFKDAWSQYFYNGLQSVTGKNALGCIRPIRMF